MKKTTLLLAAGAALLAGIQFIRPDQSNPHGDPANDIGSVTSLPSDVKGMLERSCFNCHSNRTSWPWYSRVAPVSWLVAYDVNEGRKHLNFSEWQGYSPRKQSMKLEGIIHEVEEESMPPGIYVMLHADAVLSPAERTRLIDWAGATADTLGGQEPAGE